jgi:hypothetical protein
MCGLVCIKTIEKFGFTVAERDEFNMMMVLNSFRGSHSTGIAGVNSRDDGKINLVKAVGSPMSLRTYDKTDVFMGRFSSQFDTVIGHGRYATRGAIDAYNAHPYEEGHITLAHNGVIANYNFLRDYRKHKDIEVDSHLIARMFSEDGVVDTLERIEGAYVFIWYNSDDQTLNVCRNNQRPLFIGKCKDRKTMIMASEKETIIWNSMRNNTPMTSIEELPPYQIHTFQPDSLDAIVTEYRPYVPKPVTYHKPTTSFPMTNTEESYRGGIKLGRQKLKTTGRFASSDDFLVGALEETAELAVGERVKFEIHDYSFREGCIHIYGYNENYPTFKFRLTTMSPWTDEMLLESMVIEAEVSSFYCNQTEPDSEVAFSVFLTDGRLVPLSETEEEEENGEGMVNVLDCDGVINTFSMHRMAEMADEGCAWSQCVITNDDLKQPKKLLYHHDESYTGLVCPECARPYLEHLAIVH